MKNYDPMDSFREDTAEIYDDNLRGDEAATVAFLSALADGGSACELAIGTGRIALPLAAAGVHVDGIDLSEAMVAKLRTRSGGEDLSVVIGNFADVPAEGTYRLIYLVYNTLFNLLTQVEQVRCFENVARHLDEGGTFVVEGFVPSFLHRLRDNQYVDAEHLALGAVTLDVGRHDPVAQIRDESHILLSPAGMRLFPVVTRYAWPSELDLMAGIAGLRLKERWAGWEKEPFTAASRNCVSVYER